MGRSLFLKKENTPGQRSLQRQAFSPPIIRALLCIRGGTGVRSVHRPDNTGDAMDGDTVQVTVEKQESGRPAEGTVIKVLKRANETVVGM